MTVAETLGLAAREEGRAVGPGEEPHFDGDGPDFIEAAAVGPLALIQDEIRGPASSPGRRRSAWFERISSSFFGRDLLRGAT